MSVHRPEHNDQTRARFEDVLHEHLISRDTGAPETKRYTLLDSHTAGESARISVHNDAWCNAPLETGQEIKELYFEALGIVILDLNPPGED